MTDRDDEARARRELREIAEYLTTVASALRDIPDHFAFANGGAVRLGMELANQHVTVDAAQWPTVAKINALLERLHAAKQRAVAERRR
jgi:hypothetical protein